MDALHADSLRSSIDEDFDETMLCERTVVLRNLVSLRKVGIEVILSRPLRLHIKPAIQAQSRLDGHPNSDAVQNRQRSGQTEANRTRVDIGRLAELGRAGAEKFRVRKELSVTLQPNNGFVALDHTSIAIRALKPASIFPTRSMNVAYFARAPDWTESAGGRTRLCRLGTQNPPNTPECPGVHCTRCLKPQRTLNSGTGVRARWFRRALKWNPGAW